MILYRILLAIDAVAAAVVLYFFMIGLADGSVSSFNMGLWLALLASVAAILFGGLALNARGRRGAAMAVLALLAAPAFLFALFALGLIVLQPRWN